MNKKILAILLALLMVVVSGVAMAEGETTPETQFAISKTYETTSGTKPAQAFEFEVENSGDQINYPLTISNNGTISFTEGDTETQKTLTVTVPGVGTNGYPATPGATYNYVITEKAHGIQGIAEDNSKYYVKVTVYNNAGPNEDPDYKTVIAVRKDDANAATKEANDGIAFANPYSAGALTVTKKLEGNLADLSDTFSIKVTFSPEQGKSLTSTVTTSVTKADESNTVTVTGVTKTTEGNYEFTINNIGHNDVVTFNNVPAGASWNVEEETNSKGYTPTYDQQTGTIAAFTATNTNPQGAVVTNTKTGNIDTGVTTDTMPYILLMAIVAAAAVIFLMKKRTVNE